MDITLFVSSGTRAPGSNITIDTDDNDDDDDKGGLPGEAVAGIVLGSIPAVIIFFIIVQNCNCKKRVPNNETVVRPVAAPNPTVIYNVHSPAYPPYGPEPGLPMHATSFAMPPSYDQSMSPTASAPPLKAYYNLDAIGY